MDSHAGTNSPAWSSPLLPHACRTGTARISGSEAGRSFDRSHLYLWQTRIRWSYRVRSLDFVGSSLLPSQNRSAALHCQRRNGADWAANTMTSDSSRHTKTSTSPVANSKVNPSSLFCLVACFQVGSELISEPHRSTPALNFKGPRSVFECIDNRARFEYNLRCPWRSDTVDRELFVSSTRQAFQRGVVRLSAMNRSWVSPFGDKSFSLGASPCKACSPSFMVHFIVFSSLFRVLFVLPVGLAWLDVFRFSFRRLECSCHPSHDQSTKGDFRICWAPALARSSILGFHVARKPPWKFQPAFFFLFAARDPGDVGHRRYKKTCGYLCFDVCCWLPSHSQRENIAWLLGQKVNNTRRYVSRKVFALPSDDNYKQVSCHRGAQEERQISDIIAFEESLACVFSSKWWRLLSAMCSLHSIERKSSTTRLLTPQKLDSSNL